MGTPRRAAAVAAEARKELARLAVSYTRYSTEEQGSTPEQQAINEELAAEAEITMVKSFHDEGVSRSLSERPGLMQMFNFLESNPDVKFLIVNELERLTAGIGQRQKISSLCKRLGVTILTEDIGAIDPHDDEKMHEADQRSVASQGEVLKIRRRVRRNLRSRVRSKRTVAQRPPYGVRMVPLVTPDGQTLPSGMSYIDMSGKRISSGAFELHPDEYPHLLQMFEWSAEGVNLSEIARRLNQANVPTKMRRGPWSASTVVGILDNPFYKGQMTWGLQEVRRDEFGKKFYVVRPKGDPGRIDMESPLGAIITEELWESAAAMRRAKSTTDARERQPRQVLDGLVFCERCGHKMYGRNNADKARRAAGKVTWSYQCKTHRPGFRARDGLPLCTSPHTMMMSSILDALTNFDREGAGNVTVTRGVSEDSRDMMRRAARERVAKALAAITRAEDLAVEGDISREKLREVKAREQAIVEEAETQIEELGLGPVVKVEPLSDSVPDGFLEWVELIRDERLPLNARIAELSRFGLEKIYVDKPHLRLQLRGEDRVTIPLPEPAEPFHTWPSELDESRPEAIDQCEACGVTRLSNDLLTASAAVSPCSGGGVSAGQSHEPATTNIFGNR